MGFLAGFDVVFLTALWLFGEYLLENKREWQTRVLGAARCCW